MFSGVMSKTEGKKRRIMPESSQALQIRGHLWCVTKMLLFRKFYGQDLALNNILSWCTSGVTKQSDQEPHFLLCYRKEPHRTHGHTWTSHHLFPAHIPCSARFLLHTTHQHDNDRNLQAIYCYPCYLWDFWHSLSWINTVCMYEPHVARESWVGQAWCTS